MDVYVIVCEELKDGYKTVSSECYDTYEKAENFILNRSGNVKKVRLNVYVDEKREHGYIIKTLSLK